MASGISEGLDEVFEKEKETVKVAFSSKEAILVHMLYYIGAAILHHDFQEAEWLAQNVADFVNEYLAEGEITTLKAKMTKVGNDVPLEDLKTFGITLRART